MTTLFVPRERRPGEARVAATPETIKRFAREGFSVLVEEEAGRSAFQTNQAYEAAGARIVDAATSTRPCGLPSSILMAFPKVLPASMESATFTRGFSLATVNQATATRRPLAEIAGPFTGHASISHPSLDTVAGADHFPFM